MKSLITFISEVSFMKRLFVLGLMALAAVPAAIAQQNPPFIWFGTHTFVETNDPPPVVDSPDFTIANGATFGVDLTALNLQAALTLADAQATILYQTSDTLNYTNNGILIGVPGIDFEYYPNNPPPPQPGVPAFANEANTFANIANGFGGGAIYCTNIYGGLDPFTSFNFFGVIFGFTPGINFNLPGLATFRARATNIEDSGLISMDETGLIDLTGQNVNLTRATLQLTGSGIFSNTTFGVNSLDYGFGQDTNGDWVPSLDLAPPFALSSIFTTVNNPFFQQLFLTNAVGYFENNGAGVGTTNDVIYRGIFLQDSSPPNVTKEVFFGGSGVGAGAAHIQWSATVVDPVTGAVSTNYFYLSDLYILVSETNFLFAINGVPNNFTFAQANTPLIGLPAPQPPGPPPIFNPPGAVTNFYSYVNADLISTTVPTNVTVFGALTNVPGRVQIEADGSLNLNHTHISGNNYLSLKATNNFVGNTGAVIEVPYTDMNLRSASGSLTLSNLLVPQLPHWSGSLQAWSANWIFVDTNGVTNDYRMLLVNSDIEPTTPAQEQDVILHSSDSLVISDEYNILRAFSSDAAQLTLTTNGPGAFSPMGELNLLSPDIFWSSSLPDLQYLTNWGEIDSQNFTVFAGNMFDPYSDPNAATPYQAFINHGTITNGGVFVRTGTFVNSGVMDDPVGSIDISASGSAVATNGLFLAPGGYVSIGADTLIASNGMIEAGGGPLTLSPICSLSDGYVLNNQFGQVTNSTYPYIVTNGNTWVTSGGVRITMKPGTADLLGTTITNLAFNNMDSINTWPGVDLRNTVQGFGDNLALGRMILNADPTSVFDFATVTGNNALYVDSIELQGNTTNTDGSGNPLSVAIEPGMNIYYAQALENGVSIAEKLNGKHGAANIGGGQFFWISNYAGVYSSTNIFYKTDGNTYIFNRALAISPDIASGGPDGSNTNLANKDNPEPIPTNEVFTITNLTGPVACPGLAQNPPGQTNPPPVNSVKLAQLAFPAVVTAANSGGGQGSGVSFTVAQGSYNGLFYDTNGVNPSSSGSFTAKMTSKGGFSAKLQLGTGVYSFSGMFNSNSGNASNVVSGKHLATLDVDLQLTNNDQIIGSVSGSGWTSQLLAERAATVSSGSGIWVGKDTLLLSSDRTHGTANTGQGFGSVIVSANSGVQWSAVLADGTKLSEKSALSQSGIWPVYAPLYGGSGVFIGWLQCTNQSKSDITGSAVWVLPPGHGMYPAGLTNQINAAGSRVVGSIKSGVTVLSGAALESSLTNKVTIFDNTIYSQNSAWKMSLNPQTGLFSGSVAGPNSGQKLSFQGAFLERSGTGGGFFLNADQSGKVYFGPAD